jgi:hypothetical protein
MQKILFIACCFFLAAGCAKDSGTTADNTQPVVVLSSPVNGQVFTGGATVNIAAAITDNVKLAEIHVHISNQATGQLLIDIHRYPDAAAYTLNENFQVQSGINYTIKVLAIDKSANEGTQTVSVTAN